MAVPGTDTPTAMARLAGQSLADCDEGHVGQMDVAEDVTDLECTGGRTVPVALGSKAVAVALGSKAVAVALGGKAVAVALGGKAVAVALGGKAVAVALEGATVLVSEGIIL